MPNPAQEISEAVAARGYALSEEVKHLIALAEDTGSPIAYAMVGDLIQLLEDTSEFELADAEAAYRRAIEIDPNYGDGHASLGFFLDAVMADPVQAKIHLEKASALGVSEAKEALAEFQRETGG